MSSVGHIIIPNDITFFLNWLLTLVYFSFYSDRMEI